MEESVAAGHSGTDAGAMDRDVLERCASDSLGANGRAPSIGTWHRRRIAVCIGLYVQIFAR
jgi:hypothetical protein